MSIYEFWFKSYTKGKKGRCLGTLQMDGEDFRDNLPTHAKWRIGRKRGTTLHKWENVFGRWVVVETF